MQTVRSDPGFGEYVVKTLEKAGVPPASLTFEVMTSGEWGSPPARLRKIACASAGIRSRAAGVTFALSWFAGEELALSVAPKMGFTYLKLDPSLAVNVATDVKQQARLSALVKHCREMGLRTISMWVETAETLAHLRALQVDYVQGFGIARPKPLEGG